MNLNIQNLPSASSSHSSTSFDLETYASRYHGRTKIQRLLFIASISADLKQDALKMAIQESKLGYDTKLYRHILEQVNESIDEGYDTDEDWIREKDQWAVVQKEAITNYLNLEQPTNREMTRSIYNERGDYNYKLGRLQEARGDYIKTRDYCMNAENNLQMCVKVVTVSIQANDFTSVESYYMTAETMPGLSNTTPDLAKLVSFSGLAHLVRGNYQSAATRFLACNPYTNEEDIAKLQSDFGEILSLEDVAIYGGLCALATMDRQTLTKQVLEKPQFHYLLELVPSIREIVHDFHGTRYTRLFQTMQNIRNDLMFDLYLGKDNHLDRLYQLIRRKAMVQYVYPFVSADLSRMKSIFNSSSKDLETELLSLIESGDIQARIDRQNNALIRKRVDFRKKSLSASLRKGQQAFDDTEAMLLRMTLTANDIKIHAPNPRGMANLGGRNASLHSVADNIFDRFHHV